MLDLPSALAGKEEGKFSLRFSRNCPGMWRGVGSGRFTLADVSVPIVCVEQGPARGLLGQRAAGGGRRGGRRADARGGFAWVGMQTCVHQPAWLFGVVNLLFVKRGRGAPAAEQPSAYTVAVSSSLTVLTRLSLSFPPASSATISCGSSRRRATSLRTQTAARARATSYSRAWTSTWKTAWLTWTPRRSRCTWTTEPAPKCLWGIIIASAASRTRCWRTRCPGTGRASSMWRSWSGTRSRSVPPRW